MIWIRAVFWLAALYEVVIGLTFLILGEALFARFDVPAPNHPGYYEFPALLLLIFGVMFARIALNPMAHRTSMWFGVALKASYAGLVLTHHFSDGIPSMWLPFAFADLGFLVLFVAAWVVTGMMEKEARELSRWL